MRAVSLFSGGLDSQLAVCLIKDQGIDVVAVNFVSPFFGADPRFRQAASQLKAEYHEIGVGNEYMEMLKNPVYGYGKNFNPCIDCHAFMIKRAGVFMREIGASFLFTGEVLGERPMSQNKNALYQVEKLSGCQGLILRPLSAKLLPPTIPEIEGWVDRDLLLDLSGRGRTRQMELAEHYGLKDYPTPAGGCLLTQEAFTRRLRLLLSRQPESGLEAMEILKLGRHFLIAENVLLVVGRNHSENERLSRLAAPKDYLLKVTNRPGPTGLVKSLGSEQQLDLTRAAAIVARYSDARDLPLVSVSITSPNDDAAEIMSVVPVPAGDVPPSV